jgi:hypothetical protein
MLKKRGWPVLGLLLLGSPSFASAGDQLTLQQSTLGNGNQTWITEQISDRLTDRHTDYTLAWRKESRFGLNASSVQIGATIKQRSGDWRVLAGSGWGGGWLAREKVGVGYSSPTYKGSVHLDIGYAHYAGSLSVTHFSAGESYYWPHFRAYVALSVYRQTGIPSAWTWGTQGTLTYYSPYGRFNLSGGEGLVANLAAQPLSRDWAASLWWSRRLTPAWRIIPALQFFHEQGQASFWGETLTLVYRFE